MIVRQSGIMNEIYQSNDPENLSRQENIEELINGMHDFCATREEEGNENILLTDFLSEVSLLTDQDNEKEGDAEKITLMTIHSAKGLEFKNVFVVGMEENLFPSALSLNSYKELEEERRLFYVAITRAEEHCYLSFAKSRFKYDLSSFTAWRILADGISPVLAGDETICKPLFGEVAEVYRNGVNRLANQPTKRFHPERFLYSSLVNRVLSSLSCSNMVLSSCVVSLSKMKAKPGWMMFPVLSSE